MRNSKEISDIGIGKREIEFCWHLILLEIMTDYQMYRKVLMLGGLDARAISSPLHCCSSSSWSVPWNSKQTKSRLPQRSQLSDWKQQLQVATFGWIYWAWLLGTSITFCTRLVDSSWPQKRHQSWWVKPLWFCGGFFFWTRTRWFRKNMDTPWLRHQQHWPTSWPDKRAEAGQLRVSTAFLKKKGSLFQASRTKQECFISVNGIV